MSRSQFDLYFVEGINAYGAIDRFDTAKPGQFVVIEAFGDDITVEEFYGQSYIGVFREWPPYPLPHVVLSAPQAPV